MFAVLTCIVLILLIPSDGYLGAARADYFVSRAIGSQTFRFAAWEAQALTQKFRDQITRPTAGMTADQQHDLVVGYFDATQHTKQLVSEIEDIYADPYQTDPARAAAALQAELDALRAGQAVQRPAVERILEQQVSETLRSAGLTTAGQVLPPLRFQFTESPYQLIVSPRAQIRIERSVLLSPALPVAEMARIEDQVGSSLDKSTLVEGTGGFSSYPTMVIESSSMRWVLSTIAHEWGHTYLAFRPLGWHYFDNGDTRTINETTVSILGDEIADLALARYYPEKVPPPTWPRPFSMRPDWWTPDQAEQPPFEFGPFMRQTRLHVDDLLADGRIEEAETYMAARRQILVANGYAIRRLNQAYFAFHGSYAVGAAATDPIGGKLRALRNQTGSLVAFVRTVSRITQIRSISNSAMLRG